MERLMSAKDVQAYLQISRSTLYVLIARGDIPEPYMVSKQMPRWDPDEIRDYFTRRNGADEAT